MVNLQLMRTVAVTVDNASGLSIRVMFSVHFVRVKHFKLRVLDKKNSYKNLNGSGFAVSIWKQIALFLDFL